MFLYKVILWLDLNKTMYLKYIKDVCNTLYGKSPNERQQDEGDLTKYNCSVIVIGQ